MLDRIPTEVLGLIVRNVHTQSDLKSLCEVSKPISKLATPHLYESITLQADDTLDLDALNRKVELPSCENVKFTRSICVKAPLNYNLRKRCPHYDSDMPHHLADTLDMDDDDEVEDPFADFAESLTSLFWALKDDNLQSFSFDLGCCVPTAILGDDAEFFFSDQKRIRSISLITDGGCPTFGYNEYLNLKPLISLQSLSWKGLIRGDHFDSLKGFIKNQEGESSRRLRTLTLDLVEWSRADQAWYEHQQATLGGFPPHVDNFFATSILGIEPEQENILFQSLETLRLTGVAFSPFENEFSYCLNMMNLSTLQLRNCPASLELLEALLNSGITLKLKSFELAIDWDCLHYYGDFNTAQAKVIFRFLESFEGLEDLFLLLTTTINWYLIGNSIANHQSTLKRLVVHERDTPKGTVVDGGIPCQNSGLLFCAPNMTCFGTSGPISGLEESFTKAPTKPRCKVLHIRTSWIDYSKQHEEELRNQYDSDESEPGDIGMLDISTGKKFPSYPVTQPSEPFDLEELTNQDSQTSKRRRNIANRSDFSSDLARDLLKFARWAFGPEGIPELRVLAWGDFSHDGRWGESNVLLCRDQSLEQNFRALRDSDFGYWDLIDGNMDMLSACSPDHLLWTEYGD